MLPERKALQFDDFLLNPSQRQLYRLGERLTLPVKAFDLLLYMAQNSGRPLPKNELLSSVWPDSFVEESNLSQTIFLLRKALGPAGGGLIKTLPGKGYQFTAQVMPLHIASSLILPETNSSVAASMAPLQGGAIQTRVVIEQQTEEHIGLWRSPYAIGISLLAVGAIAAAGWLGWQRWEDRVGGPPVQVVLSTLDGTTGDPVLDHTLSTVIRIDLAQSPFVTLVSTSTADNQLKEMRHQPGDSVTAQIARDICERTGSQAVIQESIARVGSHFLFVEEATNCVDGAILGQSRQEAARAEDLPGTIGSVNAVIRHSLGESRRMIARFSAPLVPANTSSMDALRAYSEASRLNDKGRWAEEMGFLKQAVALDPQFASAYLKMGTCATNLDSSSEAEEYFRKAYELRQYATAPERMAIVARYTYNVTGNVYEGVRNFQTWSEMYPRQPQPWNGLVNGDSELGRHKEALVAAQHLFELIPDKTISYSLLATAQMHTGDFNGARRTYKLALDRKLDTETMHYLMFQMAHLQQDQPLLAEQQAWLKAHPDSPYFLAVAAQTALSDGRIAEAANLEHAMSEAFDRMGLSVENTSYLQMGAIIYLDLGKPEMARKMLHVAPVVADYNELLALAGTGDLTAATYLLNDQLAKHPRDTDWQDYYGPLLRANTAMLQNKPKDAIAYLEKVHAFDQREAEPRYMRGKAYLQAAQYPEAEHELRALLAQPGIDPTSYELSLAQLMLARALAREGRIPEASGAYKTFLGLWSHADPDEPLLLQAHVEYAALGR